MKKLLSAIFTTIFAFCASVGFASCSLLSILKPKELQLDKEYVYTGISFKKAKDITIEDIDEFVPMFPAEAGEPSITTVEQFEEFLRENIREYTIDRLTESGRERISLEPLKSIRITEGYPYVAHAFSLWIKVENAGQERELRYGAICEGNKFIPTEEKIMVDCYYFEKGALHYDFELNDKFAVVYHYELK